MAFDSARKIKVRQEWNTPLLAYLSDLHKIRFHYFGLPGIEAHDIVLWRDYIETVTAFEAPDNPRSGMGEKNVAKLELRLVELGYEPLCYVGFLENIIQTMVDNRGRPFEPERFYTLLNLDFMNHLTSRAVIDQVRVPARYETFSQLASMLKGLWDNEGISGSVWFVTLREEIDINQYIQWKQNLDDRSIGDWVDQYNNYDMPKGNNLLRNPFKLKAFLYKTIKAALEGIRFSCYWYPMVLYVGDSPNSRMAHFMILSHANHIGNVAPLTLQTTNMFLNSHILEFTGDEIRDYKSGQAYIDSSSPVQEVFAQIQFPFIQPLRANSQA